MYESDDNERVKRKLLYIVIGITVFLILLLILFLIVKSSNENKPTKKDKELYCKLTVLNDIMPNSEGIYEDEIDIGFEEINYDQKRTTITKKSVGLGESADNTETLKINKTGDYTVYGYIQDSKGNEASCQLDVSVELIHPICTLKVSKGERGSNGWYNSSNVVVSFDNVNANNANFGVVKYFIEKEGTAVDIYKHDNSKDYTVVDEGETKITGYIMDTSGEQSTCSIIIKKDTVPPKCSIKVIKGNSDSNNNFLNNPTVGFENEEDDLSGISEKGIGIEKNYTEKTYTVTSNGTTTVKGFIKDVAGNEGTCSITVTKAPQGSTPSPTGDLNCTLHISPAYKLDKENMVLMPEDSNGEKKITITMTTKNAVAFGMGKEETYNGKNEFVITNEGTYKIIGFATNAAGVKVKCESPELTVKEGDLLYSKAKFGDYVSYDAGSGRNTGQKCNDEDTAVLGGWVVLDFDTKNKRVILVSAGSPECIEHQKSSSTTLAEIKDKAKGYINKNYAISAEPLSCNSYGVEGCKFSLANRQIHVTNGHYFLASRASDTEMWAIDPSGVPEKVVNTKAGIRIVVTLDKNVVTTGYKNGKWIITKY